MSAFTPDLSHRFTLHCSSAESLRRGNRHPYRTALQVEKASAAVKPRLVQTPTFSSSREFSLPCGVGFHACRNLLTYHDNVAQCHGVESELVEMNCFAGRVVLRKSATVPERRIGLFTNGIRCFDYRPSLSIKPVLGVRTKTQHVFQSASAVP